MQPFLLYWANLSLCGLVFLELLVSFRKNPLFKLYLILIIASLFAMNYFALTGVSTRTQFVFVKFARMAYVCGTLLALIHLVHPKIPKWFIGLITFAAVTITTLRIAYYDQINMEAVANPVFSVGIEFYSPKPAPRYIALALSFVAIIIAYSYYRRFLMQLNWELVQHKHLSRWVIALVIPFFLLTIFGILGNLRVFNETISSYLFAIFSCTTICSLVLRPRFLDAALSGDLQPEKPERPVRHISFAKNPNGINTGGE
jgi:hypothetical protein